MERVLIVAKTKMKHGVCVSGLTFTSNKGIRLIPGDRYNQASDTSFDVGQVWDIDFQQAINVEPPHTEDVIVNTGQYRGKVTNLREFLMRRIQPWRGGPEKLFDGKLTIDQAKCYISKSGLIPNYSTGYWLPDRELMRDKNNVKPYYLIDYQDNVRGRIYPRALSIPFVGFASPLDEISPDTLIRVSLARWLPPY